MEEARRENQAVAHLPDDSLPNAYPTAHFGESIFSAMLGGRIQFVGTGAHTCSGAEPLLTDWGDLAKLRYGPDMPWTRRYLDSLRAAAQSGPPDMFFWHFVTIDTLNLVVELRGSTEAYLDVIGSPRQVWRADAVRRGLRLLVLPAGAGDHRSAQPGRGPGALLCPRGPVHRPALVERGRVPALRFAGLSGHGAWLPRPVL